MVKFKNVMLPVQLVMDLQKIIVFPALQLPPLLQHIMKLIRYHYLLPGLMVLLSVLQLLEYAFKNVKMATRLQILLLELHVKKLLVEKYLV